MSLFQFITLILLSGQISAGSQIGQNQGSDGWEPNSDQTLNYIIKLTPEFADELARNGEAAKFDIPPHIREYMTSVTFQIGNSTVGRNPSEDVLKANYSSAASPGLTTLNGSPANENKFAEIDRKGPSASRIQPVNQNGTSGFGIPPIGTSNPALASSPSPYAGTTTSNPALTGNSPTSTQFNNPALPNRGNEAQYPTSPINNDRFTNSPSSLTYSDPPSVPPTGYNSPSTLNTQPLNSPFSSPSTAPSYGRSNENYNYGTGMSNIARSNEPSTSGYSYGAANNQYQSSTGAIRPSTYPGNNSLTNQNNGSFVSTRNPYRDDTEQPDYRISSNYNGASSGATNSEIASLQQQNSFLLEQIKEINSKNSRQNGAYGDTLTPEKIEDLKSSAKLLLSFQLFSIVLFVACCFLGGSLFRLYNAYRNLRVTSRHAVHLGV